MEEQVRKAEAIANAFEHRLHQEVPPGVRDAWAELVGYVRLHYLMDEHWDGQSLKFRCSNKTFVTLHLLDDCVMVEMTLHQKECAIFEAIQHRFSAEMRSAYEQGRTPEGAFLRLRLTGRKGLCGVKRLLRVKRRHNRHAAPIPQDAPASCCGNRCDQCLLFEENVRREDRRAELTLALALAYGDPTDQRENLCGGCGVDRIGKMLNANCTCVVCASQRGVGTCSSCPEEACEHRQGRGVHPGLCTPGLTAREVTELIIPYCGITWRRSTI